MPDDDDDRVLTVADDSEDAPEGCTGACDGCLVTAAAEPAGVDCLTVSLLVEDGLVESSCCPSAAVDARVLVAYALEVTPVRGWPASVDAGRTGTSCCKLVLPLEIEAALDIGRACRPSKLPVAGSKADSSDVHGRWAKPRSTLKSERATLLFRRRDVCPCTRISKTGHEVLRLNDGLHPPERAQPDEQSCRAPSSLSASASSRPRLPPFPGRSAARIAMRVCTWR